MQTIILTNYDGATTIETIIDGTIVETATITQGVYAFYKDDTIFIKDSDQILYKFKYRYVSDKLGTTTIQDFVKELAVQKYFNIGGGSGVDPGGDNEPLLIHQEVDFFDDLVPGTDIGDLAVVRYSSGVKFINFKDSGFYIWDGTNWISDDASIINSITQNYIDIQNKADINHTHVKADITDFNEDDYIKTISSDPDNAARIGTDGGIYVPQGIPDSASVDLRWIYRSETTDTDPTQNFFQTNNSNPALVTEVYLSEEAYPNRNVENILNLIDIGDAIYLQQNNSSDNFINAEVSSTPIDKGNYWCIPITVITSGDPLGLNQFSNIIIYHSNGGGSGSGVPNGGLTRQVLSKNSDTNNDYSWNYRYNDLLVNVEYTGITYTLLTGQVLEATIDNKTIFRYITNDTNLNGYPVEDSFYNDFTGLTLLNLIIKRG